MMTPPRHTFTCCCDRCHLTGSGDFAVRAYADGEKEAIFRLAPPVASVLPSLVVRLKSAA